MQQKSRRAINPSSSTLTLRGIDSELRAALEKEAARRGSSLNALILQTLRGALGTAGPDRLFHDLDHLIGSLSKEDVKAFERGMESFEQIDADMWEDQSADQ